MNSENNKSNFDIYYAPITRLSTVVLGTPESLNSYSKWQDDSINVVRCYSIDEEVYTGVFTTQYLAELTPAFNPSTGCQYPMADYFSNNTDFEKDNLYNDSDLLRYYLTSSATDSFSQTFSESSLQGNQFAVACTAFSLQELGCGFRIIVCPDEVALVKFCEKLKWNYEIVNQRKC